MDTASRAGRHTGKALMLIILIVSVLSVVVGGGVGVMLLHRSRKPHAHDTNPGGGQPAEPATMHSLGEMVVNLADIGVLRYAKITVSVGFEDKIEDDKLKDLDPILHDALIHVITAKRFGDLHRIGGLDQLKVDLKDEFSRRIHDHRIVEVYLESFGMQ